MGSGALIVETGLADMPDPGPLSEEGHAVFELGGGPDGQALNVGTILTLPLVLPLLQPRVGKEVKDLLLVDLIEGAGGLVLLP